jgi:hypothetical protein
MSNFPASDKWTHNFIYTTYSEVISCTPNKGEQRTKPYKLIVTKYSMHIVGNLTLTPAVLVATASNNKHKVAWQGTILS